MQTERMTMAQALVRFLNQQYVSVDGDEMPFVEGVATIFGHGNVLGIGQALEQDPGHLQVMQGCNEQGIAHMATGFAKQHRRQRIFAVTSSVGPGAANMVTAAATATANRIPLLLLPGDIYASRQPDPVLQQIEQYPRQYRGGDPLPAAGRAGGSLGLSPELLRAPRAPHRTSSA